MFHKIFQINQNTNPTCNLNLSTCWTNFHNLHIHKHPWRILLVSCHLQKDRYSTKAFYIFLHCSQIGWQWSGTQLLWEEVHWCGHRGDTRDPWKKETVMDVPQQNPPPRREQPKQLPVSEKLGQPRHHYPCHRSQDRRRATRRQVRVPSQQRQRLSSWTFMRLIRAEKMWWRHLISCQTTGW